MMTRFSRQLTLILLLAATIAIAFLSLEAMRPPESFGTVEESYKKHNCDKASKIIFGYVTSWSKEIPDPFSVTHLSYAFATIDDDFKSLTIKNGQRFSEIVRLKTSNPDLKILLSIGGWGAGNFSEMASSEASRSAFIGNAMKITRDYGLDGLDIDWEFPGSSAGKISSSKYDRANFTELMKQLRDSLGASRILSFASPAYGNYYDYKNVMPYVDFVNVMAYDMAVPPKHHSPLNHSEKTGRLSVKDVIVNHSQKGIPMEKIVLGIPFYGRGNESDYKKFEDYRYIRTIPGTERRFDSLAVAPYIADKNTGKMLISYDDTVSINAKCTLVKEIGAGGIMFWHYCGDTEDRILLRSINNHFNQ